MAEHRFGLRVGEDDPARIVEQQDRARRQLGHAVQQLLPALAVGEFARDLDEALQAARRSRTGVTRTAAQKRVPSARTRRPSLAKRPYAVAAADPFSEPIVGIEPGSVMEIASREIIRAAVAQGLGIAAVSEAEHVPGPGLHAVRIGDVSIHTHAHFMCLAERQDTRLVRAFVDVLAGTANPTLDVTPAGSRDRRAGR